VAQVVAVMALVKLLLLNLEVQILAAVAVAVLLHKLLA
jgi:hypothetical protein